MLVLYPATQI